MAGLGLVFGALMIGYPAIASAEPARLAGEMVVRNTSGKPQNNVVLGLRIASDMAGLQMLGSLSLDNSENTRDSVEIHNDYAQIVAGDFLPGETKRLTVLQSINLQRSVEALDQTDTVSQLQYTGYQSRITTTRDRLEGDCSEAAIATRNALRERGIRAEMVSGFVISTNENTGQRLVTHHDWVWHEDENHFIDPSAYLLPGIDHQYIALGLVLSEGTRFPMYISNQEGIEVSLTFR